MQIQCALSKHMSSLLRHRPCGKYSSEDQQGTFFPRFLFAYSFQLKLNQCRRTVVSHCAYEGHADIGIYRLHNIMPWQATQSISVCFSFLLIDI